MRVFWLILWYSSQRVIMLYTRRSSIFIENGQSYSKRDDFLTSCFSRVSLKSARLALIVFFARCLVRSFSTETGAATGWMLLCPRWRRDLIDESQARCRSLVQLLINSTPCTQSPFTQTVVPSGMSTCCRGDVRVYVRLDSLALWGCVSLHQVQKACKPQVLT